MWKRVARAAPGGYLPQAETINHPAAHNEDRKLLWRALRERALHSGDYRTDELPVLPLDPQLLAFLGAWGKQTKGEG